MADVAEIGIFGGSGFYSLLEDVREAKVDTPYGPPSDSFFLATVAGRTVAFLPRHGRSHSIPPHRVNYCANVWPGSTCSWSEPAAQGLMTAVTPSERIAHTLAR